MIKGKNPTLLKVTYVRPNKKEKQEECFQVIYEDDNGEVKYAEEPGEADIWIVKPEFRNYSYNKPQEQMRKMTKYRVPISKIRYKIAEEAGQWGKAIIEKSYQENDYKVLDQLYKWPFAYGCDFQPEYYYMKNWFDKYELNTPHLSKCFLDIETDLMDCQVDLDNLQDSAFAPVNAVSVIMEDQNEVFQFCLRPYKPSPQGRSEEEYKKRYKLYEKQLADHNKLFSNLDAFYQDLHNRFDATYGELKYQIREYEKEIDLIADVFRYINNRKPNFCMIWNMRFDIQYLIERIKVLGYDPASIICSPEIPTKQCFFKIDKSTYMIEKQFDFAHISAFTQYICQMRLFASIRKSQHTLRSLKLNDIADMILKDKKVEYPDNANIVRFPYVDWILFLIYNIKDTLLQKGIEKKTNDLKTYYMRSMANLTPYNKIFKETHLLRNVREMYFEKEGLVQANNINIIERPKSEDPLFYGGEQKEEKASFKGAINADPVWNAPVGQKILGVPSNNIHSNSMDYDMGAFYPSIKIASNLDPDTLLYKASFNNDEFISGEFPNNSLNQQYEEKDKNGKTRSIDITGEAVNTYCTNNILTFAYNYLGLPGISELDSMVTSIIEK